MCAGVSTCVQTDGGTHGHIHTRTHTDTESGCEVDGHRQTRRVCVCVGVLFALVHESARIEWKPG